MRILKVLALILVFEASACSQPATDPSDDISADGEGLATDTQDGEIAQRLAHITIIATVPEESEEIYIGGNLPSLGPWSHRGLEMEGEGRERTAVVEVPDGYLFQFKLTGGRWSREGVGPDGLALPPFEILADADEEATLRVEIAGFKQSSDAFVEDPEGAGVEGTLIHWLDVESAYFEIPRHISIWLPPGYDANPDQRYPVIYAHDGQELFDPRIATLSIDQGLDEAMMENVRAGLHDPAIIVGIWSTHLRGPELTPQERGVDYVSMVIDEVMPRVNAQFRTLTGPENTFTLGSSAGGLMAQHMVREHSDVFSGCGCMSTFVLLSPAAFRMKMGEEVTEEELANDLPYITLDARNNVELPEGIRMYWDWGTQSIDARYGEIMAEVEPWFEAQGLVESEDYAFREFEGAGHTNIDWRSRVHLQLAWMLGGIDPDTLDQTRE